MSIQRASTSFESPSIHLQPTSGGTARTKLICWAALILAGLVQAWYSRHRIFSDGISYLEIARYYAEGNWRFALNSYWSPLYSWILAVMMLLLRPSTYWEVGLIHLTNLLSYLTCLVGFERVLGALLKLQVRLTEGNGLSEQTVRVTGYSVFLLSTLLLIDIAYNSPDMLGTAITLFLTAALLKIEAGEASNSTYTCFGVLLALEYLARAAFATFIPIYLVTAVILIYRRRGVAGMLRPLLVSTFATLTVALPFVISLSVVKGNFTIGEAGKLNYGWEIDGAARSTHWQGEPGDIGKPFHPTHQVFQHPAVYAFASPVPGSYPPWYEPSYWYAGISPHFELRREFYVFRAGVSGAVYLFFRSPVVLPTLLLLFFVGWRRWFSVRGILPYLFLLIPSLSYIGAYTLVYLDPRYVAGSLLIVWMCLLTSLSFHNTSMRRRANQAFQVLSLLSAVAVFGAHLLRPTLYAVDDLFHWRESEWNLSWMIAEAMKKVGLHSGEKIAMIGDGIDAEWVSLDHARIVAEIPIRWDRQENTRFRRVAANREEIEAFWHASPAVKAQILALFRKQGVAFVIVDALPLGVDTSDWHRILPAGSAHLPWSEAQLDSYVSSAYLRLKSVPASP